MEQFNNPYLQIQDPFEDQRKQLDEVKQKQIEFQRLCFEIFHMSDDGKKLYEMIKEMYIIPARYAPSDPVAPTLAIYWEGFKEAMRGLWNQGKVHKDRVNNGEKR